MSAVIELRGFIDGHLVEMFLYLPRRSPRWRKLRS